MFTKISLLIQTVKHLKPIQIKYQLLYRLRGQPQFSSFEKKDDVKIIYKLKFSFIIPPIQTYFGNLKFSFLNLEYRFSNSIDWNYQEYGKLWNYNLQYAYFLLQEDISVEEKSVLLKSLQKSVQTGKLVLEPYPVSLRSINIIKSLSKEEFSDSSIVNHLYAELSYLNSNLEYHILGNHLLENLFALSMGGAFFGNKEWVDKSIKMIREELKEQILDDGGHFELSPMYHQIIFFRLLELIDWYEKYKFKDSELLDFFRKKASLMLSWLNKISFTNGDIPLFSDSAKNIAFTTNQLREYAATINIKDAQKDLDDSGYRSYHNNIYEIKIDAAQLGSAYQPGHGHADALGFILYYKGMPLFVEQGTSTYNESKRRDLERSTEAHNCVIVNQKSQSDMWGAFRVGKRAKTFIHTDTENQLSASHNGYHKYGTNHYRTFFFLPTSVKIQDKLTPDGEGNFYLHIHPKWGLKKLSNNSFMIDDNIKVSFSNLISSKIEEYEFAESYNKYEISQRITVKFSGNLDTEIIFNN